MKFYFMSFNSIETISFDVTGTLIEPFPSIGAIYAEILHTHGVYLSEPELEMRFMSEFHKSRTIPLDAINETSDKERWIEVVQGILGEEYTEEIFNSLWEAMGKGNRWKQKPRLLKTLQALKDQNFRMIIVSNWDARLLNILSDLGLDEHFERVFLSTQLGVEKPAEEVYQMVATELAVDPSTLLHIGNSPANDFKPAIRAGWNSLLLHNRIPYGMEHGTVLGSIEQLPQVLKSEKALLIPSAADIGSN